MPIDTKPEEKIIYGAELEAAVTDGIQRAILAQLHYRLNT
jgi:hypothetical protein